MIHVVHLAPQLQWDQYQFELLLSNKLWNPVNAYTFNFYTSFEEVLKDVEGIVLLVPSKFYFDKMEWLNEQTKRFNWLCAIFSGNEESELDVSLLSHPNKKIYFTTPHLEKTNLNLVDRFFTDGYAPQAELISNFEAEALTKPLDLYFGGQITHTRRQECIAAIKNIQAHTDLNIELLETAGFTQGYADPKDYYKRMASAKVVPNASGQITPDTFRFAESLQSMAMPILDDISPVYDSKGYWNFVLGQHPLPVITDYASLSGYVTGILDSWPANINRAVAWWINKKRQYAYDLIDDLNELTNAKQVGTELKDVISVVVPCSPIPSHPETTVLDETITSIRTHLPECEIILTFDGVRAEQEDNRTNYEQFIYRVLWKCLHDPLYKNILPIIFDEHSHQVKMARKALEHIKTPLLLYVESDCPLVTDWPIDWQGITRLVLGGSADQIRLYHEAIVPQEHVDADLMYDKEPIYIEEVPVIRTKQYSQRPHIASVAFYRRILTDHFSKDANSFIEDKMHGVVAEANNIDGMLGWQNYRLMIYAPPEGNNFKRSYTIDGRQGSKKFSDKQVF